MLCSRCPCVVTHPRVWSYFSFFSSYACTYMYNNIVNGQNHILLLKRRNGRCGAAETTHTNERRRIQLESGVVIDARVVMVVVRARNRNWGGWICFEEWKHFSFVIFCCCLYAPYEYYKENKFMLLCVRYAYKWLLLVGTKFCIKCEFIYTYNVCRLRAVCVCVCVRG